MVVPVRRRTTTSPAQRTSEGRVSEEMATHALLTPRTGGLPDGGHGAQPFTCDLVKWSGSGHPWPGVRPCAACGAETARVRSGKVYCSDIQIGDSQRIRFDKVPARFHGLSPATPAGVAFSLARQCRA